MIDSDACAVQSVQPMPDDLLRHMRFMVNVAIVDA
jgi:hypothetical protein